VRAEDVAAVEGSDEVAGLPDDLECALHTRKRSYVPREPRVPEAVSVDL